MLAEALIQAGGLVDLAMYGRPSEARPSAATGLAGSPTILNRPISTSLTLRDGGSLLMGGLISGNQGAGATGVPVLGQLPVLGRLFRTDAVQADRSASTSACMPSTRWRWIRNQGVP